MLPGVRQWWMKIIMYTPHTPCDSDVTAETRLTAQHSNTSGTLLQLLGTLYDYLRGTTLSALPNRDFTSFLTQNPQSASGTFLFHGVQHSSLGY